jgi:hypothetical protein
LGLRRVCVVLVFAWLFPPGAAAGRPADEFFGNLYHLNAED